MGPWARRNCLGSVCHGVIWMQFFETLFILYPYLVAKPICYSDGKCWSWSSAVPTRWATVFDTLSCFRRCFAYKILKEVENVDKSTWFQQVPADRIQHTRATEGGHNIVRTNSRLELRRNFFSQRVAERWNALPRKTKEARTVVEFKNLLK